MTPLEALYVMERRVDWLDNEQIEAFDCLRRAIIDATAPLAFVRALSDLATTLEAAAHCTRGLIPKSVQEEIAAARRVRPPPTDTSPGPRKMTDVG
jgi:hypothetical protein